MATKKTGLAPRPQSHIFATLLFRRDTIARAIKVALVVGPVLTLINQLHVMRAGEIDAWFFFRVALTFLVPFLVSATSSALAGMRRG